MERRAEYVVACLAAMKAGGAYLILELAYPPPLLADVVADASPRIVLTQERYAERLPEGTETFFLDEGWEEGLEDVPAGDGRPEVDQDNLAFVSYSAGTTGKPKGIANPHRAPVLSYLWRFGISDYAPGDRVGCNVFFIWEMMRPLLRGATTVVIPDDVIYDPKALIRFLEEYGITETLITPSLLEDRSELERAGCGREALEAKDAVAERRGRHPHARAARHGAVAGCAPAQRLQLQRDPRGGRR